MDKLEKDKIVANAFETIGINGIYSTKLEHENSRFIVESSRTNFFKGRLYDYDFSLDITGELSDDATTIDAICKIKGITTFLGIKIFSLYEDYLYRVDTRSTDSYDYEELFFKLYNSGTNIYINRRAYNTDKSFHEKYLGEIIYIQTLVIGKHVTPETGIGMMRNLYRQYIYELEEKSDEANLLDEESNLSLKLAHEMRKKYE